MIQQSFGKYFDDQLNRMRKAMDNKNAQQNIEWMEAYEKRQAKKRTDTSRPQRIYFRK